MSLLFYPPRFSRRKERAMTKEEAVVILKDIDKFYGDLPEDGNLVEEAWQMAIKVLEAQKDGKWENDGHHIICTQCGNVMCSTDREGDPLPRNFCPDCGAMMEVEHE